ncbi:hypothetical protein C8A06_1233 [Microbacteriaceae bacterium MWH-Ta3]|nr:hypothetical protein C8A06_1233 [Microbacteriaceae bacterium MWH-Ta3]
MQRSIVYCGSFGLYCDGMSEPDTTSPQPRGKIAIWTGSIGLGFFTLTGFMSTFQTLGAYSMIFGPNVSATQSPAQSLATAASGIAMSSSLWLVSLAILVTGLILRSRPHRTGDEPPN